MFDVSLWYSSERMVLRPLVGVLAKTLGLCMVAGLVATSVNAADADFNGALRAAGQNNLSELDNYQLSMQDSVLSYYPEYWKFNIDLANQPSDAIIYYATKYPYSAMAEKLAADFVEAKVRSGDYATANKILPYVRNPDRAESCAIGQVRAAMGDSLVLEEYKSVWFQTDKQPKSCDALAELSLDSPFMSYQDKQQRLWAMLRVGDVNAALVTAQRMGLGLTALELNLIASNPLDYLQAAQFNTEVDSAKYIYALARLADDAIEMAAEKVYALSDSLPQDIKRYSYRVLGYRAGTSVMKNGFNPSAVGWFDQSLGYPFSDEEAIIYARQSIRFGQWGSLLRALDAMSPTTQQERTWQYWFARAKEQGGNDESKATARAFYTNLALENDYHGLLARDRLGMPLKQLPKAYIPTKADFQRLDNDIHFRRAFTLRDIDASVAYANREWNWAVRQAYLNHDDGLLIAAASRANDIGWYDRAIYAAERTEKLHNYSLQFLTPFREQVVQNCMINGVDPAWVYGLMRQESRFVIAARSHVGAGGLMQIMPSTAKWIAGRLGESYSKSALSHMSTNIRYGTYYLGHIHGELSNQPVLATAGYNAGPSRARRWQPSDAVLASDRYTESIPLIETRDYVKNVMTNAVYYGLLLGQGAQSIQGRMGEIPVRFE